MKTTTRFSRLAALLVVITAVALSGAGCSGRDPSVAKNDDAQVVPPPPPPPPEIRTLQHKTLFGTMPVDNRFQDPLMTFTGTGWYGFSNDFQSYANLQRVVAASPTQTPFLMVTASANPRGATLLGQLKSSTKPLHVETWIGRDGDADFDNVDVEFAGLFTQGGEQAVPMAADEASTTKLDGRTWKKYSADLAEGAIGWASIMATDSANSSDRRATFYVGGSVAVDVDAGANSALVSSHKRELTQRERGMLDALRERTRTLAPPKAQLPPALPGVPKPL